MANYSKTQNYGRTGRTYGNTRRYNDNDGYRNRRNRDYDYDREEDFEDVYDESDYDEEFRSEYEDDYNTGYRESGRYGRTERTSDQWEESDIEGLGSLRIGRQRQSSYGAGYQEDYQGVRGSSEEYGRWGSQDSLRTDEDVEREQDYGYTGGWQGERGQKSYEGSRGYGSPGELGQGRRGWGRTSDYGLGTTGRSGRQQDIDEQNEYETGRQNESTAGLGSRTGQGRSQRGSWVSSRSGRTSGNGRGRGRQSSSGRQGRRSVRRTSEYEF